MTTTESKKTPSSLGTFLTIWGGQFVSAIGSEMTNFAIAIWAWELTGKATPLSLIFLFSHLPTLIASSFAGVLVDRWNRKQIMIVGDIIAGFSTIAILLLFLSNNLEIWHIYLTRVINGLFGYLQNLAFSASMSTIVPKKHYARGSAMMSIKYGISLVLSPACAGVLYPLIGLTGILTIDITTFIIAVSILWFLHIPQPKTSEVENSRSKNWHWQELIFGFRYIFQRKGLLALMIFLLISNFLAQSSGPALLGPMFLARSNTNTVVLGSIQMAFGVGASVGATVLTLWGGPKLRINGLLVSTGLGELTKILLALGRSSSMWIPAAFSAGFFIPLPGSFNQAIWLSKVEPSVQGKVFAARYLATQITVPLGIAVSGVLADYIFEPAMKTDGYLAGIFGGVFGTGAGAGMALQIAIISCFSIIITILGYTFHPLRNVEINLSDHDESSRK
ncbi:MULTISPECIES: MFS transporter [unclassified Okeania]|uniref:MFS transporter n=1 Tax=unclassified Okeania TaxID=2634635 RepID=UPI0013BB7878|nr:MULTISPECIES: MFS transporter [unclassified Okeania]NES75570.1 MFS transporter [Okeania sp. SIO1H4]NET14452.1 MFS transporter [Okeania sp. SIO1H6]NET17999.1 MFS transporter [Okeania sp. SIO1H5]NET93001.1 MFS transporter [Okeania sp. SIO1H2]